MPTLKIGLPTKSSITAIALHFILWLTLKFVKQTMRGCMGSPTSQRKFRIMRATSSPQQPGILQSIIISLYILFGLYQRAFTILIASVLLYAVSHQNPYYCTIPYIAICSNILSSTINIFLPAAICRLFLISIEPIS